MSLLWSIVILLPPTLGRSRRCSWSVAGRQRARADNYALTVVLFAASLFFAGISTRLRSPTTRMVILELGCVLFLGSLIWIATFPISLSV